MDKKWLYYSSIREKRIIQNKINRIFHKKTVASTELYSGRKVKDLLSTHEYIANKILDEKAFMVGRFGGTEMKAIYSYLRAEHFPYINDRKLRISNLCELSGFFPNDVSLGKNFVDMMLRDTAELDMCAVWNDMFMEDYVLDVYAPKCELTLLGSLEPWQVVNFNGQTKIKPWTSALKGKKVLVIHPFEQSIRYQYNNNREKIFERICVADDILPEFELITLKAVQTLNCNIEGYDFDNWFNALDYMLEKCHTIDFDIAIIGCGAYGFPIAAEIKRMGKGAIIFGGGVQLIFGITGKRWEDMGMLDNMINSYWIRPNDSEKIKSASKIENECYW